MAFERDGSVVFPRRHLLSVPTDSNPIAREESELLLLEIGRISETCAVALKFSKE
jgi:hypothetical protein